MGATIEQAIAAASEDRLVDQWDAVIVGGGAAGGLAAEKLSTAGLRILLLDAGYTPPIWQSPLKIGIAKSVEFIANPRILRLLSPELLSIGRRTLKRFGEHRQPIQSRCYAWERMPTAFVDDIDCSYDAPIDRPFNWLRARVLHGRMIVPGHGRQYLRFGPADFAPPDGKSPNWPLEPNELDHWYAEVEQRLGLSGMLDGLSWLPDGKLESCLTPTISEQDIVDRIVARWPHARPILGRYAPPANTIEVAASTGNVAIRIGAIVREVIVEGKHVTGVVWHDQQTDKVMKASTGVVFLCASALESTRILMLSKDTQSGREIGAASNALGRNLMDHVMVKVEGNSRDPVSNIASRPEAGRCVYLPRFDARNMLPPPSGRGFGVQLDRVSIANGQSFFSGVSFAEMLPHNQNTVSIHPTKIDRWGIPILHIDCKLRDEERDMAERQAESLREIAETLGVTITTIDSGPMVPGTAVHECGTARMGVDDSNSVLNPQNECWDAKGLFVTDSSCFPSQGSQHPTLTVMALTARACDFVLRADGKQ